jgi:predicted dehydrogenase
MKVLIIGLGSIARKHIYSLRMIDPDIKIFALRSGINKENVQGVTNLFSWEEMPHDLDFIIISNPTGEHFNTIIKAAGYGLSLFIEKPPLANLEQNEKLLMTIDQNKNLTYVAFVLRFHPVLKWLKNNLETKKVIEVQAYCGSYLPDWRKGRKYTHTYSAHHDMGGGVHLDLIHEIDYLRWIFGDPLSYHAFLSTKSSLEINSIDSAHYYLEYNNLNVSVTLNYFRRDPKRILEIVMNDETIIADLLTNKIISASGRVLFECEPDNMKMYVDQMKYFINCMNQKISPDNELIYSLQTLKIALGE